MVPPQIAKLGDNTKLHSNGGATDGCTYFTWGTNTGADYLTLKPKQDRYVVPEEGKFLTCDPRYIRGVHPNQNEGRMTLCYDVWHYKPTGLDRVGTRSEPFPCRFYKLNQQPPELWLGKTKDCTSNLYDKTFTFKYPTIYREGETWKVIQ